MNTPQPSRTVVLYGGAFNPPTVAHQAILQVCVDYARHIDAEVWLMPSGPRPDKSITTDRNMRVRLAQALVQSVLGSERVRINRFELDQPGLTETCITQEYLMNTYPDYLFIWVFGSDSIKTMKTWGNGEALWEELDQLVIQRPGFETDVLPPKSHVLEVSTPRVSSTLVRERIAKGEDYAEFVTGEVFKVLQQA